MRSLVVTSFTPSTSTGRGGRTVGIVRALALLGEVEVVFVRFGDGEPDAALSRSKAIGLNEIVPSRGPRRALLYRKARSRGVPRDFAAGLSRELLDALAGSGAAKVERVVADGPTAAAALLLLGGDRPIYYNAHNLESALRAQLPGWDASALEELTRFERRLLELARESWLPSERDLSGAAELAPGAGLRLVPNVVDVAAIVPVRDPGGQRAVFVADYSYEPNRHSARFLVTEVMPKIWSELPEARLALVGRGLHLDEGLDSRIELRGFVEDLPSVYATARCVFVPLLESGGSPLKMIEAMAYGLPIVATPLAAGGVDGIEDGVHFLEGEGADRFAAAAVSVLTGQTGAIGPAARSLAESDYSIEALKRKLAE